MSTVLRAPWSRLLVSLTVGVSTLLVGISVVIARDPGIPSTFRPLVALLPIVLLVVCALFTVRGYEVAAGELRIRRLLWSTPLPLEGLRSAEVDPRAMARSWRLLGNGGLFSFSGLYRNKKLGNYRAFATDPRRAVVLEWDDRTVVVTPERPDALVDAIHGRLSS